MTLTFSPPGLGGVKQASAAASAGAHAPTGGEWGSNIWLKRFAPISMAAVILSVWLLSRPYQGIVNDTRIYVGRALADLDPQGLGREAAFRYDDQTTHTIFSHLILPLVSAFGPSATSTGVTLVILLTWLAAAAWLANRLMPRCMVPAALVCVALLPAVYGPFDVFSFGQALATPRGFAEAGVLAGLAALLGGRNWLCTALILAAAAFHPIMAAPGFGVLGLVLAKEDRRWWGLVPLGLIGLLAAGALHLGPAKTLFTVFDPSWRHVLYRYKGFLFLTNWSAAAWCGAALSATTVGFAAMILKGRCRTLAVAALFVAAAGLATSFVLGDLLGSVLVVQLQLWRALWIVQVLAVLLIPVLAVEFWTMRRRDARVSIVLIGLSWLELNETLGVLPVLAVAVIFAVAARWRKTDLAPARAVTVVSTGALGYILGAMGLNASTGVALLQFYAKLHFAMPLSSFETLHLHLFPILAIALAPLVFPTQVKPLVSKSGWVLAAACLLPLTVLAWDQRTPTRRLTDLGQGRAELNRLIGPATGAGVIWMPDDNAPWFLLSRTTWVSDLQGAVGTFSRPLIMQWKEKTTELVASGLGKMVNPDPRVWPPLAQSGDDAQTEAGALRVCALKNGPQAIVLAGDLTQRFQPGVAARWRSPVTGVWRAGDVTPAKLIAFDYYTIVRCNRVSPSALTAHRPSPL